MKQNLAFYYNDRAKVYDKVYEAPEEQNDLQKAGALFQQLFAQKTVLEIACGTGYWTAKIAETASSIVATDINETLIDIAKTKISTNNVSFQVADMYHLSTTQQFDGLFGGFIWSHILLQDLDGFLAQLQKLLTPHSILAFIDSNPLEGSKHDLKNITRTDQHGNTFQTRQLENGSTYEVLKNFPSHEFLIERLSPIATEINVVALEYYWIVCCKLL